MGAPSDQYAGEQHYDDEHETEQEVSYEDTNVEPQPQAQQDDPNQQQYQQRSAPPSRSPPPPPPSQPAQSHYSKPTYQTQPPRNYPPQASPQQFPPHPAQPVQGQHQNYPTQASPQPYHQPQPNSPYHASAAAPGVYQNSGYTAAGQGVQPAPGYMVQQSPYQMSGGYGKNPGTVGWSTGLFDCMDDPTNAFITACCPCFTFGQIAEIVDNGHTTCGTSGILYCVIAAFTAVPCLISCTYRTKMRNQYDLIEVPAADWLTHCFCEWCSLCQEYRELRNRGLDPALGWQGNMMRNQNMQQQPQVAMMPPVNQTMAGPNFAK